MIRVFSQRTSLEAHIDVYDTVAVLLDETEQAGVAIRVVASESDIALLPDDAEALADAIRSSARRARKRSIDK